MKKKILVLGCSGSIGKSTLSVIKEFPNLFSVCGLQSHTSKDFLLSSATKFSCDRLCLTGFDSAPSEKIKFFGKNSLKDFIQNSGADIVVNGIAGSAGLLSSVYTLEGGIDLALANKETMVMAGKIVQKIANENHCKILPVDSEHSAIFSLLNKCGRENVENLIITASGGPFRNYTFAELENVTLKDALAHPTWNMGPKITIDSSTLANKGLEVIEALMLFDFPIEKIKVVVHPQSLVHSMVQTKDGAIYAQISNPDMCHPILASLTFPDCIENPLEKIDLSKLIEMQFMPPRFDAFPMLNLAFDAAKKLGSYPIAFNAANEIAVDFFRKGSIKFTDIAKIVGAVMSFDWSKNCTLIDDVLEMDKLAREKAILCKNEVLQ